ncbi:MAG: hypothetical protein ACYC6L_02485 [Anaerolineae bacterium]
MPGKTYIGVIIAESLENDAVMDRVKVTGTEISKVTEPDVTPWLDHWTIQSIEVDETNADEVAQLLSTALKPDEAWYADYHNDSYHYIIFRGKVFKVDRSDKEQYRQVKDFGTARGIPGFQLDFS